MRTVCYKDITFGIAGNDYNELSNLPQINGTVIKNSLTLKDLDLYDTATVDNMLASMRSIKVLDHEPTATEIVANTMYYIGTAAPYTVILYGSDKERIELGSSSLELTDYLKKSEIAINPVVPEGTTVQDMTGLRLGDNKYFKVSASYDMNVIFDAIYPVGSIYMSMGATLPANFVGTWDRISEGKFLMNTQVAADIGKTGGEATHTLTVEEMPTHAHGCGDGGWHQHYRQGYWTVSYVGDTKRECVSRYQSAEGGIDYDNGAGTHSHTIKNKGDSKAHNNLPPYVKCSMWQRIA